MKVEFKKGGKAILNWSHYRIEASTRFRNLGYNLWSDLSGKVVKMLKKRSSLIIEVQLIDHPKHELTVHIKYLKPYKKPAVISYKKCICNLLGQCKQCHEEFVAEQKSKGLIYNKWTRLWEK